MMVGGYTSRVRKARDVPRTRYLVDIGLWERCAIRGWFCGWHVILHVPAEWENKIKMEDVFSYIVFATSGSSIAARAHLWCWLATIARRLLLYGCAQCLRETKIECVHLRHLTLCKKNRPVSIYSTGVRE